MKALLSFLFACFTLITFGQQKTVTISNRVFTFQYLKEENDSGEPIQKIILSRGNKKLLTHTISAVEVDCNSESVELGNYETTDTSIIFYTYWARAGDAPVSPYGVRKQVYIVDTAGNVSLAKADIYIETSRPGWQDNKGVEYLWKAPKTGAEKKLLAEYIAQTEKQYHATFVTGDTKAKLITEVKAGLKTQIQAATKNWQTRYANKLGGYKM